MRVDLTVHIVAGALGILSGFVALSVAKGGNTHRRVGTAFVYTMITMALVGALMALVHGKAPEGNAPIGVLTTYLVLTSLITIRPPNGETRRFETALVSVALAVSATLMWFGVVAATSPRGTLHGLPTPPFFIFGTIALLSALGDLRVIRMGGVKALRGVVRLNRHLWRMTLALAIAAFSFFLGQAKVIPKPFRIYPLLAVPPVVVLLAMAYWVWRIRVRRRGLGTRQVDTPPRAMGAHDRRPAVVAYTSKP